MAFSLAVIGTTMVTAFPSAFMHRPEVGPAYLALAVVASCAMLWHELRFGFCVPRLALILTNGLTPALAANQPILGLVVFSVGHWLTAIGLSSYVFSRRWDWAFAMAMLLVGAIGFAWIVPTPVGTMTRTIPVLLGARAGLGFVHFMYDRWVYKLSDPRIRAAIGGRLLDVAEGGAA